MKRILTVALISAFLISACSNGTNEKIEDYMETSKGHMLDAYEINFCDNTPFSNENFRVFCPSIQFEELNEDIEEKVNDTLYQASTSWIKEVFIKDCESIYAMKIFCHTANILSIGQSYEYDKYKINNYITIDLSTGEQIYLRDIISDEYKLAHVLHDASIVTTSRNAFTLDQDEADNAIKNILREMSENQIVEMIQQCSLEQKEFHLPSDKDKSSLPYIYERPNFYVENGLLVIEEGEWHNKIIIKIEDIDSLIEPKYKKYFID